MEELRYSKVEEIKVDSKLICEACFKPTVAPIICSVIGLVIFLLPHIAARILGSFFVIMSLVVMFFLKDKKTIDVYEKGAIIYNSRNAELAYYLDFENVAQWDVSHENGHDTIEFTLVDGNKALVDTFQANKVFKALEQVIPDKNYLVIQAKRNKEINISPVDALKNLLKKK